MPAVRWCWLWVASSGCSEVGHIRPPASFARKLPSTFEHSKVLSSSVARCMKHSTLVVVLASGRTTSRTINLSTLASCALLQGRVTCVTALLTRGADIRHRGPSGQTALHCAASGGGALVARTLVAAGADPGAPDDKGRTPVDLAR